MTSSCRSIGTTTYDLRPKAATQSGGVSEASLASSTITGRRVSIARALVGTSRSGRLVTLRNWSHMRSEEHTSELQSRLHLVCRLLLEKKNRCLTTHHRVL